MLTGILHVRVITSLSVTLQGENGGPGDQGVPGPKGAKGKRGASGGPGSPGETVSDYSLQ